MIEPRHVTCNVRAIWRLVYGAPLPGHAISPGQTIRNWVRHYRVEFKILADALQDAGFEDEVILEKLRDMSSCFEKNSIGDHWVKFVRELNFHVYG